ncbi:MAG: transaldolase family protein [Dehalococcoidia bacterium]|nr:transaldolase family protein [Dehalococcoidia bacterium]
MPTSVDWSGEPRRVSPLSRPASVASFFVSRLDTAIDAQLPADSSLRGKAAVANARDAYRRFLGRFSGPRWRALEQQGARVQRPLWASTGTKNPDYSDVLYVEELIAPHTVNTLPEATLQAVLDHAEVQATIEPAMDEARKALQELTMAGIDLRAVTDQLLIDGLASFDRDFQSLLDRIRATLAPAAVGGA